MFDKIRNRFSFNFLAICGWISFWFYIELFYPENLFNQQADGTLLIFLGFNFILNTLFFLMTISIFAIEFVINKKITNQKFLKSKFVFCLQILGIIFFIIPFVIFCVQL